MDQDLVHGQQKLPDKVYALLLKDIVSGLFMHKGKLPSEMELAQRFDVSRPTVRQAISRLRAEGVVASRRGAGSFVIRVPANRVPGASIESIADIDRYYAYRMCIEAGAAAIAAAERSDGDLQAIRAAMDHIVEAMDLGRPTVDQDVDFHLAIACASHNQFFVAAVEDSVGPIRQCIELASSLSSRRSRERNQQVKGEHVRIVESISRGVAEDAAEAMRQHIARSRRRLFEG